MPRSASASIRQSPGCGPGWSGLRQSPGLISQTTERPPALPTLSAVTKRNLRWGRGREMAGKVGSRRAMPREIRDPGLPLMREADSFLQQDGRTSDRATLVPLGSGAGLRNPVLRRRGPRPCRPRLRRRRRSVSPPATPQTGRPRPAPVRNSARAGAVQSA